VYPDAHAVAVNESERMHDPGIAIPAEQAKRLSMPPDKRPGLHHVQGVSSIEPTTEPHQSNTGGLSGALRFDFALLIHGQLFAQKKIFGREGSGGAQAESKRVHGIDNKRKQHGHKRHEVAKTE
jgi:hypothetical protein